MKLLFKKTIAEGCVLPRFYGPAYDDMLSCSVVCYPLGIHLVVRFARRLWHWYLWNIDKKTRKFTMFDNLEFTNRALERAREQNKKLKKELEALTCSHNTFDDFIKRMME